MMTETRDDKAKANAKANANGSAAPSSGLRYPTAIAICGGVATAIGSSFIPMNAIEGFVSAYGIAELLPAAAPPLGNTARLALSAGIGTLTAGALLALLPRGDTNDMGMHTDVTKNALPGASTLAAGSAATGLGATKFMAWLKTLRTGKSAPSDGEITDFADLTRVRVRKFDKHPDAPIRAPIMANSDFAVTSPALTQVAAAEQPAPVPALMADTGPHPVPPLDLDQAMAFGPVSAPDERSDAISDSFTDPMPDTDKNARPLDEPALAPISPMASAPTSPPFAAPDVGREAGAAVTPNATADTAHPADSTNNIPDAPGSEDLEQLSITALLARLEHGLETRRTMAAQRSDSGGDHLPSHNPVVALNLVPSRVTGEPEPGYVEPIAAKSAAEPAPFRFRVAKPLADEANDEAEAPTPVAQPSQTSPDQAAWTKPAAPFARSAVSLAPAQRAYDRQNPETTDVPGDSDMDNALHDALATLRKLSGQAGGK